MNSSVAGLKKILGAGSRPAGRVPWASSRAEVGFEFPSDYRELVDHFGSICINGELVVMAPRLHQGHLGLGGGFPEFVGNTTAEGEVGPMLTRMRARRPAAAPYPVWPSPGGLLYWGGGRTSTRNACFWITEGDDPDRWPVAVWLGIFEWARFEGGIAEFLLALVTGAWEHADRLIHPRDWDVPLFEQLGGWGG